MSNSADWGARQPQQGGAMPVRSRPRIGPADLILQLWRAKWLMILVFIPIFLVGLLVAFQMPKSYEATSRLYVRIGDENVYRPRVGAELQGVAPEEELLIQAELEVLRSPVIAERVLTEFGLEQVYPKLADARDEKIAASPPSEHAAIEEEAFRKGVIGLQKDFSSGTAPKTPVISTALEHKEAALTAALLNYWINTYLDYRNEVFSTNGSDSLQEQRVKFEGQLLDVEEDIRDFLRRHNIGDFESERATAQQLFSTVSAELLTNQSRASAVDGQLDIYNQQLARLDPQQDLYVEDSSAQTLMQLRIEREDLLSRYTEQSQRVQAIDRRIAQVENYLSSRDGLAGTTRRGPNPVYQTIEQSASSLQAEQQSLALQEAELNRQLARVEARLSRLNELAPEWQELQRRKALMERNVENFSVREVEERALSEISGQTADSVRVLEPARVPVKGKSLKMVVAALGFLFAGFTALMAGLLWALTRRGFATARSVERTTGLKVVGSLKTV
ncbi:hypothetical protein KUV46_10525 [Thalassovita mediterranea]|nr:hypothetical protein KUV46_10525 [Thalassovita mediterranea]